MRLSPLRHTLAVLRTFLGLTQKEMAEILECSVPTVQAIELGKLKMSMKLAGNLFHQTSINLDWLMKDDVSKPPIDFEDKPYTRETFEHTQAMLFAPPQDSSDVRRDLFYARASFRNAVEILALLYGYAYKNDTLQMCDYKISNALDELLDTYVGTEKLTPEEKERSLKLRLHAYKPADLMEPIRRFIKETDDIFQKRVAEFEPKPPGGKHPANANDLPPKFPKVSPRKKLGATKR